MYMYSTESMSVATIIGVSAGGAIFAVVAIVVLFLCGKCVCIKEVSFFCMKHVYIHTSVSLYVLHTRLVYSGLVPLKTICCL